MTESITWPERIHRPIDLVPAIEATAFVLWVVDQFDLVADLLDEIKPTGCRINYGRRQFSAANGFGRLYFTSPRSERGRGFTAHLVVDDTTLGLPPELRASILPCIYPVGGRIVRAARHGG